MSSSLILQVHLLEFKTSGQHEILSQNLSIIYILLNILCRKFISLKPGKPKHATPTYKTIPFCSKHSTVLWMGSNFHRKDLIDPLSHYKPLMPLVVQWLGVHFPMQGIWVKSLVENWNSIHCGTTQPEPNNNNQEKDAATSTE